MKNSLKMFQFYTILAFLTMHSSLGGLPTVNGDEHSHYSNSVQLEIFVSQTYGKINYEPLHPGNSTKAFLREKDFIDDQVQLHFLSKSFNTVQILAIRRDLAKCPQSYLPIPESDWSFNQTTISTNFRISPSLDWEGLVFVSSSSSSSSNVRQDPLPFWGWSPISFDPCHFTRDKGKCQRNVGVPLNAEGYVTVTYLNHEGQQRLKQGMREMCPQTLAEIYELLHNKEKETTQGIPQENRNTNKIYYNFDADYINLCVNSSDEIKSNTGSPLDYANQIRQLDKIEPQRYMYFEGDLDPADYNCVSLHISETEGNSFSITVRNQVGIIRMKFNSRNTYQWTPFFYSDQANKGDYITFGQVVQNRTQFELPIFYDTWQYSSNPLFSRDTITCTLENMSLEVVSSQKVVHFGHCSVVSLQFAGILPENDEIDGECRINFRHYDNSIVSKVVKFSISPPPKLHLEGSLTKKDDNGNSHILRIQPNATEIHGVSIGSHKVQLNCSNKVLLTAPTSQNGSFSIKIDQEKNDYENCILYAEGTGGLSNPVEIVFLSENKCGDDSDGMSVRDILLILIGILVLVILAFAIRKRITNYYSKIKILCL